MSNAAVLSRHIVLADLLPGARVRDAALVVGGAGLTGVAAQISFHTSLSPVPFTLQSLAVLVVGASLGSVRGLLSMLIYLAAGLAGVPWFSSHSHGATPSFGYVIGFVVAAGLVGALAKRGADRNVLTTVLVMVGGTVVIYLIGTVWLAVDLNVGAAEALKLGVRPFLVTDAIKVAIAALAFPTAWQLVRRTRG
jgi:biotin transport system substrate-specific component